MQNELDEFRFFNSCESRLQKPQKALTLLMQDLLPSYKCRVATSRPVTRSPAAVLVARIMLLARLADLDPSLWVSEAR
eukprot:1548409-Rhodomonas_salina.1